MVTLNEAFRMARKAVRVSQALVAEQLGVSRPTVSAIERKDRELRVGELVRVAALFRMSPEVMMSGGLGSRVQDAAMQASFRADGGKTLDDQEKWELFNLAPSSNFPTVTTNDSAPAKSSVPTVCEKVRSILKLEAPPLDIFGALYRTGYRLEFTALSNISGALMQAEGCSACTIVVNSDQPDDRLRWTAVHEFAHRVYRHLGQDSEHVDLYGPARLPEDQEADLVAAEILMPALNVLAAISKIEATALSSTAMYRLADEFHVSYTAMVVRCGSLGVLSPGQVQDLRSAKPSQIEGLLKLKESRRAAFDANTSMPQLAQRLANEGRLPPSWFEDFTTEGPHHIRRLQSEAAREYILGTKIVDRKTSVTELFEEVAKWVAREYPWSAA
ncbi:MAG TPA: hypothetical protein DCQ33_03745 [Nitrospira sp.]|nr:hypothetical protein [Nitrospira sp.]